MGADYVLYGNAIFDSVKDEPFEGAIAIEGKHIVYVGDKENVEAFISEETVVKDYTDHLIMPGMIDSHAHLKSGSINCCTEMCDLFDTINEQQCVEKIKAFAAEHPDDRILSAMGWDLSLWEEGSKLPTKHSLDAIFPDRPVVMMAGDGHALWVNTKMLEMVDVEGYSSRYKDELIERDSEGNLTGIVKEEACFPILDAMEDLPEETIQEYEARLLDCWAEAGITGISEVSIVPSTNLAAHYNAVKKLDNEDALKVRIYIYPGFDNLDGDRVKEVVPYEDFFNTDTLRIAGIKGALDGVTSSYTALMIEPYADKPETRGVAVAPYDVLEKYVIESNRLGYGVKLHCIGDLAVRQALDAYEASSKVNDMTDVYNCVEHMEVVDPEDVPRFKKWNVTASMQPLHEMMDEGSKIIRCGERSRYEWTFRSLLDAGAHIALGTDYGGGDYRPLPNIYIGITKKSLDGIIYETCDPAQAMTLPEALKGYTAEGARCNGMLEKLGTLEVGKYADITVIDRNLFQIPVEEIKEATPVLTMMNGRITFEAGK